MIRLSRCVQKFGCTCSQMVPPTMILQLHLVFLILLAAVIHAVWNAVVKTSGDRFLTFSIIHFTGVMIGLLAVPLVDFPKAAAWPFLVASVVIHNLYYIFLMLCYRHGDFGEVYPIARGSSPILVAVLAFFAAGESPTPVTMISIGLVSSGIISLMFVRGWPTRTGLLPIALALATGALIASYTVVDGLGLRAGDSPWPYIVWLNMLEGLPFAVWAVTFRRADLRPYVKAHWKPGVMGGCLTATAYALVLYALDQGAMSHVSVLRETSVLFAAIIGTFILKERFGLRRGIAAVLIVAGVLLLQVGQ